MSEMTIPSTDTAATARDRRIMLGLVLVTLLCYWPLGKAGFVNFDDPVYITQNRIIQQGFSPTTLRFAFTDFSVGYWHPLTWISHLIDIELYGPKSGGPSLAARLLRTDNALPAGHHFTSLLIHLGNTLLLWILLKRMTGAVWTSAWVAAIFAVHPMHVESVAWIAERKDVLCTLFVLLTMLAYCRYTERPTVGRYLAAAMLFAAALLSKPIAVTVPCVLLLLDVWPLNRITLGRGFWRSVRRLLLEKLPMLLLSVGSGVVTIFNTIATSTNVSLAQVPMSIRLQTVFIGYARYLQKFIWPSKMAVFYPLPTAWPMALFIGSVALFIAITAAVLWQASRWRFLLVGWLWFAGVLVPVIGFLVVSDASMADRYSYISYIGLLIAVAWLASDVLAKRPHVLAGLAIATIAACVGITMRQVGYWQNSQSLMGHALAVTSDNWSANIDYALALNGAGQAEQAGPYFKEAVRIRPGGYLPNLNYAQFLIDQKEPDEANPYLSVAAKIKPNDASMLILRARALALHDHHAEAAALFERVLSERTDSFEAEMYLSNSLIHLGRVSEAEKHLRRAIAIDANSARAYYRLGQIAATQSNAAEAVDDFKKAIELDPNLGVAHLDYGITLARLGRYADALQELDSAGSTLQENELQEKSKTELVTGQIQELLQHPLEAASHFLNATALGQQAVDASPNNPAPYFQLAITFKQTGKQRESIDIAQKAMNVAVARGNVYFINELRREFPSLASTTTRASTQSTTRTVP